MLPPNSARTILDANWFVWGFDFDDDFVKQESPERTKKMEKFQNKAGVFKPLN